MATVLGLATASCSGNDDIHLTEEAKGQPCYNCHSTAYKLVQNPKHIGVFPVTCAECHATRAWLPASSGHPESKFPIASGSHSNKAIGCADCHIAGQGPDTGGQNCDCTHCHIGAHVTPAIDAVHTGVSGYTGSTTPGTCLSIGCHPSG
jgi:hypothetical protein